MFALPALGDVIVSLALLLLALAGLAFVRFLHDATDGLPFPLNAIASAVWSFATRTLSQVRSWAVGGLSVVGAWLLAMFDVPRQLFDHLVTALETIWTLGAALRAAMTTLYHQSLDWSWKLALSVQATVKTDVAYLTGLIAAARADATHGIDRVATDLGTAVAGIDGAIGRDVAHLEGLIDTGIGDVARALVHGLGAEQAWAARSIGDAVAGLEGRIVAGQRDVIDWVDGIARDLGGSIERVNAAAAAGTSAAVAGVLAWIQAGAMATVATLGAEIDDCLRPNCEWMRSLGGTLSQLGSALEVVALFAFLAQAIADPGATATEIEAIVNPVDDVVYKAMADVLGALY